MDDFEPGVRIDLSHTRIGRALETGDDGETSEPIYATALAGSPLLRRLRAARILMRRLDLIVTVVVVVALAVVLLASNLHVR